MARRRRIRWPALAATLMVVAAVTFVLVNPSVLGPAVTHLVNRQIGGTLRVGHYDVRPFAGLDAHDVTLTLPGERGGLTLVAADTLELDFNLREVMGLQVRLRRLEARGVEIYHNQDEPADDPPREFAPPRLQIDLLSIQGARAEVSDHQGRLVERIDALDWRGEMHSDGTSLQIFTRHGRVDWPTRSSVMSKLYGGVTVDAGGVRTEGLSGVWNDGEIRVSGLISGDVVDLEAAGRRVRSNELVDLTGLELDFDAVGDIDIAVDSRNDTIRLDADFTGRIEAWQLRGLRGEAIITDAGAVFHRVVGGVGEAAFFDGTFAVDSVGVVTIDGEARDVDIRRGLIPDTDPEALPRTAGRGRLHIVHTPDDEVTRIRGTLVDGEVEIMPFDSCRVDIWARSDSLHFHDIDLLYGSIHARLEGSSNSQEVFQGDLNMAVGDLRDLPAAWEWPELTGRARGSMSLYGPVATLGISGSLSYDDLTLGPMLAAAGEATLVGEQVLGESWRVGLATSGPGFHLGGVPLGDYRIWLRADASTAVVDSFRAVHGDTVLTAHGRADFEPDQAVVNVDRGAITLAGNRWRLDGLTRATMGPGLLSVPRLRLISDQGELLAEVDYHQADSLLTGNLEVRDFDLNLLDPFLREDFRPGGLATANIAVSGRPHAPVVEAEGSLVGARFEVARLDTVQLRAGFAEGVVHIDTLDLVTDYGRVLVRGDIAHDDVPLDAFWPDASLDLDLEITDGDWTFLEQFELEALERLTGGVDGQLHAEGTTSDPVIRGDLQSAPFTFQWLKLDRLHGTVRVDRTQLALGGLVGRQDQLELGGRVEVPLRFDLLSAPESPPDGPFLAHLRVPENSDLAPLQHATSAFTRVEGRGEGEIIISGPLSRPQYQGRVALRDVGFVLRGNEEVYHHCRAEGEFRDDRLILDSVTGQEGLRGTFEGSGHVLFDGLVLSTWDFDFTADRFLIATIPDLRAVVRTRNGRFNGVPVGPDRVLVPRFAGDFEIIKGRYTGTFADPGTGAIDPTLGTVAPDWLADVRITGPPRSARIVNATMELDLSGDITLVRDADGMVLNGAMNIDNGRLPVFHNTFRVVRGNLDFSRAVGVIPNVDLDAETRVRVRSQTSSQSRVERVTVHASGPASAMTIGYSSESGYPREAIERMLLGLSPYPDEQGDQAALTAASIGAGFNIIEREIAREVTFLDTIEIDQIQRQQTAGVGLDPLIGVGKYLGTDLYIKYAQGLNQNDRDLLIEYQINDLLLLQTEVRRRIDEYQGDATYNVDLKYRYEY